jgi:membrane protease YdiL (CAAX protease family)
MENKFIMKMNENSLWVSALILAIMAYWVNLKYSIILIFWIIIIISAGNAKRIFSKKYFIFSMILRRSLYVIPFLLPLVIDFKLSIVVNSLLMWGSIGVISGVLFILPKINEWRIVLSKDMIEFSVKKAKIDYYTQIFMLLGAAICEEIFFRNFVIGYVHNVSYVFSILLSCVLFFLNHFGVKWNNNFNIYDYIIQIIFAVASSILFILSGSILPSIIAHIIYNFPLILLAAKSYTYHYNNRNKKEEQSIG